MRFIFDRVEGSQVRNTINGIEIVRRVTVVELPIQSVATTHRALLDVIRDNQCPRLRTVHPDATTGAVLEEHQLVSVERDKRRVELDLIYRAAFDPGSGSDQIIWTVEDSPVVSHILTNATSNQGAALAVWYVSGEPDTTVAYPGNGHLKGMQVHKAVVDRSIRVTGRATKTQWRAFRVAVRAAAGTINNATWGGYPRGEWLFVGPQTRTIDRGNTYDIALEFWWKRGGHYPVGVYTDEFGNIPSDVAREQAVRTGGPPPEGQYKGRNGVMMASVQPEANFSALFNFTPDEEPGP